MVMATSIPVRCRANWPMALLFLLLMLVMATNASAPSDIRLDEKAKESHRIDSLNILVYVILLTFTVMTIWMFKHRRARYLHETGLAVIYGLIVGAIIRYASEAAEIFHLNVRPSGNHTSLNGSILPDTLWLQVPPAPGERRVHHGNKTYVYIFRGEIVDIENNEIDQKELDQKATFDPEIFFNILLPPIIFAAGYSLKRRYFFRNLGAILTFALVGTTISCLVTSVVIYGFVQLMPHHNFPFNDCLFFGALVSATDPGFIIAGAEAIIASTTVQLALRSWISKRKPAMEVTILAIFSDLKVDVNLYALVFGESVLNDAVAIALTSSIQNYAEKYQSETGQFETVAFFQSLGNFLVILFGSLLIGSSMGCFTALLTKFTKIQDFPQLESALFFLMSYSTFLIAEAADLTGIVAVLFCGICQAHYTYNNLSIESRSRTKQIFELLNFLAENFIFCYIGVSMFTFQKHNWDLGFICASFLAIALGRAINIYPLSFLLNLGRNPKLSYNFQHVLFFSGLRGAMAFALAIRNTHSIARQTILTATSLIVMVTVIVCGGFTTQLLAWLNIPSFRTAMQHILNWPQLTKFKLELALWLLCNHKHCRVGVEEDQHEMQQFSALRSDSASEVTQPQGGKAYEKAWLIRIWYNFDVKYMKPLLTHSRPTLLETLPVCCMPLARFLTSTQQLSQPETRDGDDSDTDLCIDETELSYGNSQAKLSITLDRGDLGLGEESGSISTTRVRIPGPSGINV